MSSSQFNGLNKKFPVAFSHTISLEYKTWTSYYHLSFTGNNIFMRCNFWDSEFWIQRTSKYLIITKAEFQKFVCEIMFFVSRMSFVLYMERLCESWLFFPNFYIDALNIIRAKKSLKLKFD